MIKKKFYNIFLIFMVLAMLAGCSSKTENVAESPNLKPEETVEEVQKEPEPEPEPEPVVRDVKISVTGDLMVHSWQYNEAYNSETGEYDFMHNFSDVKKYFADSDLVIGNFETVLGGEEIGYSDYPCFNTPDAFLDAVKDAGFNFLTTANNHCMDKGINGLLRTLDKLDEAGIDHTGTFRSQEERDNIFVKDYNGIKIAIVSYTYGTNGIPVPEDYNVNILEENALVNDIKKADEIADFVIVLPHMGNEYEEYVRDVFKDWVDIMFEAGADAVFASHPHVLQPMEYKTITEDDGTQRTGFVIYSLGNFISSQTTPPRNAGVILNMNIQKVDDEDVEIMSVSVIPVWTQFRNVNEEDHFIVRSVYEMLTLDEETLNNTVRQKDIARLKDIHYETTKMLLNKDIPIEEIQDEYVFEKPVEAEN